MKFIKKMFIKRKYITVIMTTLIVLFNLNLSVYADESNVGHTQAEVYFADSDYTFDTKNSINDTYLTSSYITFPNRTDYSYYVPYCIYDGELMFASVSLFTTDAFDNKSGVYVYGCRTIENNVNAYRLLISDNGGLQINASNYNSNNDILSNIDVLSTTYIKLNGEKVTLTLDEFMSLPKGIALSRTASLGTIVKSPSNYGYADWSQIEEQYQYDTNPYPTAKILTAPQPDVTANGKNGILEVSRSWCETGKPYISWMCNDNSNYGKYYVRISTNDVLTEYTETMNDVLANMQDVFENRSDWDEFVDNFLNVLHFGTGGTTVPIDKIIYEFNQKINQMLGGICYKMNEQSFTQKKLLTSEDYEFSEEELPYNPCRVFSFCLSDYINVVHSQIYKIEIVDSKGKILDYTYIFSSMDSDYQSENYGTKTYSYEDYDKMIEDIIEDNPDDYSTFKPGMPLVTDNEDLINSPGEYENALASVSDEDLFEMLSTSINDMKVFFNMSYNILPAQIIALVVAGMSMIVVLRVLSR